MPPRGRAHHEADETEEPQVPEEQTPDAPEEVAAPAVEAEVPASAEETAVESKTVLVVAPAEPHVLTDDERLRVPSVFVAQVRPK